MSLCERRFFVLLQFWVVIGGMPWFGGCAPKARVQAESEISSRIIGGAMATGMTKITNRIFNTLVQFALNRRNLPSL